MPLSRNSARSRFSVRRLTASAAADAFEAGFVRKQRGILKRLLLRAKDGSYADLVFFASKADADRVVEAESTSNECLEFFSIMQAPDASLPDMGVLSFEHVKTYG